MTNFANALQENLNVTTTANGDKAYKSTLSHNLDIFFGAGGVRGAGHLGQETVKLLITFKQAQDENPELALRNLINIRNHRLGGLGERQLFRTLFISLDKYVQLKAVKVVPYIGRWDDLVYIFKNSSDKEVKAEIVEFIKAQLNKDLTEESPSLLAKWLPSDKGSKASAEDKEFIKALGFKFTRDYRKVLSKLRPKLNLIETKLTFKKYKEITLENIPSRAFNKYKTALWKYLPQEMEALNEKVEKGETTIKMAGITPDEIVHQIMNLPRMSGSTKNQQQTIEAQWNSFGKDKEQTDDVLVLADVSGSMYGKPIEVSVALAIYFSERATGQFKNTFLTFTNRPKLVRYTDNMTLKEKVNHTLRADWGYNTDVAAAFQTILDTAVKNKMSNEDLPSTLLIVSDMQFDSADRGNSSFESAREKFEAAGYKLPNVVFWNVSGSSNVPVTVNDKGVSLVSGFSPSVMNAIVELKTEEFTPEAIMRAQLFKPEYDEIIKWIDL